MCENCGRLGALNLSNWDMRNAENVRSIIYDSNATSITALN
jgi:surface protein